MPEQQPTLVLEGERIYPDFQCEDTVIEYDGKRKYELDKNRREVEKHRDELMKRAGLNVIHVDADDLLAPQGLRDRLRRELPGKHTRYVRDEPKSHSGHYRDALRSY